MTMLQLIWAELRFRKLHVILGLLSITAATASLVGAFTLLQAHDIRTTEILAARELATRQEMIAMEEDYRTIMRDLGHNVMILHAEQDVAELRFSGYPTTFFPEEYAERLGRSGIETLNHLLPILQTSIHWPEYDREVIVSGISSQVPVYHRTRFLTPDRLEYIDPITEPIPAGTVILGWILAQELGVTAGDTVELRGQRFTAAEVQPRQGNQDDFILWCNLDQVQTWLDKPGQINGILALECVCHPDDLGLITQEVTRVLPDTQVLEFSSLVIVRHEARERAALAHERAIDAERAHRAEVRREQQAFTAVLLPVVFAASAVWIFFLMLGNVRERRFEIGILRAIGVGEQRILLLFLSKALLIGLIGALFGSGLGLFIGVWFGSGASLRTLFDPLLLLVVILAAPAATAAASWIPALLAAQTDPAEVLRHE